MGRSARLYDILNRPPIYMSPSSDKNYGVSITSSITTTFTLLSLQGPGVISSATLKAFYQNGGPVRTIFVADGVSSEDSTSEGSASQRIRYIVGSGNASGFNSGYDAIPFENSLVIMLQGSNTTIQGMFYYDYRLV